MKARVVVSCIVLICLLAAPAFGFGVAEPVTGFFSYVFGLFSYADEAPQVTDAFLNQYKFVPGDHMMITAHVVDDYGVDEVRAEIEHDAGVDVVNLVLVTGNEKEGTYQGQWVVHDCSAKEYDARIVAVDSSGQEGDNVLVWEDPLMCNPGHQAEDVCPGVFGGNATGAGDKYYTFPGDVRINGDLDMTSKKITNVALPTANSDAVTKGYVDAASGSGGDYFVSMKCEGKVDGSNVISAWIVAVSDCPSECTEVYYHDALNPDSDMVGNLDYQRFGNILVERQSDFFWRTEVCSPVYTRCVTTGAIHGAWDTDLDKRYTISVSTDSHHSSCCSAVSCSIRICSC